MSTPFNNNQFPMPTHSPLDIPNQLAFLPSSVLNSPPSVLEGRTYTNSDPLINFVPPSPISTRVPPTSPYVGSGFNPFAQQQNPWE